MRIAYLGTPEMAVPPLEALHAAGHDIAMVISRPDARRGRRASSTPSPVKATALALGLPVGEDPAVLADLDLDLAVVVAYGRIISADLLARVDMINLHFSLLPRWRGAAPVERAILAGDALTGVCVMTLEEGLDTGPIHATVEVEVGAKTADELRVALVQAGTALLVDSLAAGLGEATPQATDSVTYAEKITADDLRLDWSAGTEMLLRQIRVGGAWTMLDGQRFKVLAAEAGDGDAQRAVAGEVPGSIGGELVVATGDGALRLQRVQPAGKAGMDASAWANGARPAGKVFGG